MTETLASLAHRVDLSLLAPLLIVVLGVTALLPALDRGRDRDRTLVSLGVAAAFGYYLIWRVPAVIAASSVSPSSAYTWFVFILEILAMGEIALFLLIMSRTSDHSAEADRLERNLMALPASEWPRVDILIPTYNEGPEVLERSILAAKALHYERFAVWVCDDGQDRLWLRDMCKELGVGYLTREDRQHAKAGNINAALARTDGDLIAVFDADFAPARNFLLRTVGFFADPQIGLVQTPQHFFNRDPVQTNLAALKEIPDEQRLFFDHMAASRDAWGCAFCCGAGSIVRRTALEQVGGVPTASVTEDLLTSLAILRAGYRTRYLNERLAVGLAPENLEAYVVQRRRWCEGAVQGLFTKEGPLGPGLRLLDRLLYFPTGWLVQHPIRLIMLSVPALYFLTGVTPFPGLTPEVFISIILPLVIAAAAGMMWFAPGCYVPLVSTAVGAHIALHVVPSALLTLVKHNGLSFVVTPKGKAAEGRRIDRRGLTFAIGVAGLTAAGMAFNGTALRFDHDAATFNAIANAWGTVNLVICFLIGVLSIDRRRPRVEERFDAAEPVTIHRHNGDDLHAIVTDLSTTGARLEADLPLTVGETVTVDIFGIGATEATVTRAGGGDTGLRFGDIDADMRTEIINRLFAGDLSSGVRAGDLRGLIRRTAANFF